MRPQPTSEAYYLDIAIGAVVESRRGRKKLTQQKLAAKVQISQPRLSRIEAGASLTLRELRAFETVLGKKIEADAQAIVSVARLGAGSMLSKVRIGTEELIPLVAKRWT
jgi:transcriptional regulator with XRE-family HTH domain